METDNMQIVPASYNNRAKRIRIPDISEATVPHSPENTRVSTLNARFPVSNGLATQPGLARNDND
jgi:hypothetical protein